MAVLTWSTPVVAQDMSPIASPLREYVQRASKLGMTHAEDSPELVDSHETQLLRRQREEALPNVVGTDPDHARTMGQLDKIQFGSGWLPTGEAGRHETKDQQAQGMVFYGSRWCPPEEAEKLRESDRNEVGWLFQHRVDTPHLVIFSSESLAYTKELSALLENEVATYERFYDGVWSLKPHTKPIPVFLFGTRADFVKAVDISVPSATQGGYNRIRKILYVGKTAQGDRDQVTFTATHELVHALDDYRAHMLHPTIPLWIVEGRADHFSHSVVGGQVLPGAVWMPKSLSRARELEKALATASIRGVVTSNAAAFHGRASTTYVLAWAFVHFLFHGEGGKHAAGFGKFLSGLPEASSLSHLEAAVGTLQELEPVFKAYVRETLLPAALSSSKNNSP
jgi:hypothetical protein